MKKILKKSLACMLAAILCLTACVGAMATVGAEGAITYSIESVVIPQGKNDTIDVTISGFEDVAGLIAEITLPDAVETIDRVKLNDTVELVKMTDDEPGHYVLNGKTIKFVGLFNSLDEFKLGDVVNTLTINIDVTVVNEAREAAPITAVFAAGDFNEGTLAVTGTDGSLTVEAVCQHAEIVTENVDVVDATCTTDGSYTIVTKCKACGVETADRQTITVEATGHAYDDGVVTTAPDCENAGVKTFTCANCGDTYTQAIDALGHKAGEATKENEKAADCVNAGSYDMVVRCTVCNAVMSTETTTVPATGHTPAEAVEENRTEAQPGVAGSYDMVVYCSVCDAEISRTTNEIPALPVVPAEPQYNANLKFASASVGYGTSSLQMAFRVMKTVVSSYESFEVVITPSKYNPDTKNLEEPQQFTAKLVDKGSFYEYIYTDIQLYELGLQIKYELKARKADGTVEYADYQTSPAQFLKETYAKSTNDKKLRTLIVDTLVVGDAAAKTWGKSTNDLGKAESIIKDFDISEATQDYGTPNSVLNHTATNPDYDTVQGAARRVNLGVAIGKVPYINYRLQNCKDLDINKLSINVAYSQTTGKGTSANYNYTFTSADAALTKNESNGLITLAFDQIGLADGGKDIAFTVMYDGQELCNTVYSIETFLGTNTGNATIGTIAVALLKLSASASAYYS